MDILTISKYARLIILVFGELHCMQYYILNSRPSYTIKTITINMFTHSFPKIQNNTECLSIIRTHIQVDTSMIKSANCCDLICCAVTYSRDQPECGSCKLSWSTNSRISPNRSQVSFRMWLICRQTRLICWHFVFLGAARAELCVSTHYMLKPQAHIANECISNYK